MLRISRLRFSIFSFLFLLDRSHRFSFSKERRGHWRGEERVKTIKTGNKRRRRRRRRTSMNRENGSSFRWNKKSLVFLSASLRKWKKGRRMHSFIAKSFRFVRGIRMKCLRQEVSNETSPFFQTRLGRWDKEGKISRVSNGWYFFANLHWIQKK